MLAFGETCVIETSFGESLVAKHNCPMKNHVKALVAVLAFLITIPAYSQPGRPRGGMGAGGPGGGPALSGGMAKKEDSKLIEGTPEKVAGQVIEVLKREGAIKTH